MNSTVASIKKRPVPLTHGAIAWVSPEDHRRVLKYKWHLFRSRDRFYARCKIKGKFTFLHNFILNHKPVDHRNNDGLDNTRENIRVATNSQNAQNRRKIGTKTSSRFKGVYLFSKGVYRSLIRHEGKQLSLGLFKDEVEAAKAYDEAAKKYYGEFANLNFPEGDLI